MMDANTTVNVVSGLLRLLLQSRYRSTEVDTIESKLSFIAEICKYIVNKYTINATKWNKNPLSKPRK